MGHPVYIFVVVLGRSDLDRSGRVMKFSTDSLWTEKSIDIYEKLVINIDWLFI